MSEIFNNASTPARRVVVIGGGISGLATAYFLHQQGIRPVLVEKADRLGGLIRTDHVEGCQLEAGPDSFIAVKPALADLAGELGIADLMIGSNDERRRIFIARDERLVPMPKGMVMMVPGDLPAALRSNLFSLTAKFRLTAELLSRPRTRSEDVPVGEFIVDHFGNEVLDTVTEPLLSGVYGGDSARLSSRSVLPRFVGYEQSYGSLVRGVHEERARSTHKGSIFLSFRGGMQALIDALQGELKGAIDLVQAEVSRVEQVAGEWLVHRSGGQAIPASDVVLACPASVNARLLRESCPQIASELADIPYSSAILVTVVYERPLLGHALDGFGFLVPKRQRKTIAAATWVSTKFPSRTPLNLAALRAFIVGDQALEQMQAGDDRLIGLVKKDFQNLMGIGQTPLFAMVSRWPGSMPQYVVGHERRTERIRSAVQAQTGLHVCGNAYEGVGIPDCVRIAKGVAARIGNRVNV